MSCIFRILNARKIKKSLSALTAVRVLVKTEHKIHSVLKQHLVRTKHPVCRRSIPSSIVFKFYNRVFLQALNHYIPYIIVYKYLWKRRHRDAIQHGILVSNLSLRHKIDYARNLVVYRRVVKS